MSALTCDFCGGNLVMNESGDFAICESCGMKHTKERVKVKVQEIKGVVEVTKGDAEKERLIKNAETFLSLNETEKAQDLFSHISDEYPADYRGWLGLAGIAQKTINKCLMQIEDDSDKVCFANLSLSYAGNASASKTLSQLSWLHHYYQKLIVLDKRAANEITKFEEAFVADYHKRNLPFINWLSANVLKEYKTIAECSPTILKWAEEIVDTYISKFISGEIDDLYWRFENPFKKIELYPAALAFLQKAYDNAQYINRLSLENQRNLLRSLGADELAYPEKCVFWLNKTLVFVYVDGYGPSFQLQKTKIALSQQGREQFVHSKVHDMDLKCKEIIRLISSLHNHEPALREIITKFTNAKIKESSYDWETDFSYRITKIDAEAIEYTATYMYFNDRKESSYKAWLRKGANFDDILIVLRRHNNKCCFCGGNFKGVFTKVCTVCGKAKNY